MLTFSYSKSMHVSCGIAGSKASEPVRLVSGQKRESRRYKLIPNWKRWKQKATDHLNEYWRSDYPRQICPADKPVGTHRRPSSALQSSLRFRPTWNIKKHVTRFYNSALTLTAWANFSSRKTFAQHFSLKVYF